MIEANLGIICASLVTLRPLFHRLRSLFSRKPQAKVEHKAERGAPHNPTLSTLQDTQISGDSPDVEFSGATSGDDKIATSATVTTVERAGGRGSGGLFPN